MKNNNKDARFAKLTLLQKSETIFANSPAEASLETFDNSFPEKDYEITFNCPEFTSLCPVTGQPDFGEITINYIPNKLCIESKSLKIFLFTFRNFNTFHEEVVNIILDELVARCEPRKAEVIGEFKPRGGISLKIRAEYIDTVWDKKKNEK